jgi:hypothetical protein
VSTDQRPLTGNPHDPEQRGELIGIGGQYTVHDIGNGRVMKIPNSMDGSRRFVGGYGSHVLKMKRHKPLEETAQQRDHSIPHVLRLAARYPVLYEALARPDAAPGLCFTQDRVKPLRDLIPSASPDEIRGFLDGFADVCQLCWRYGIHDNILFFVVNNAIDASGKVVMVDFGEVGLDTPFVAECAEGRKWETSDGLLKGFLPDEYHAYYFQAMKDRLSGGNFERHWATDLDELDREIIRGPKLKSRREDIPGLVEQILERANREEGWEIAGVAPDVMDFMLACTWGGSGVVLQNLLYRMGESCSGAIIEVADLPGYLQTRGD